MPIRKCLSIRQPFAWLVVEGHKPIENRSKRTNYRGPLFIHAPLKMFDLKMTLRDYGRAMQVTFPDAFRMGGIVGVVDLVDVVTSSRSKWFNGPYGWVLENPRPLPFEPADGKLGIFHLET